MPLICTTAAEEDLTPEVIAFAVPPFVAPGQRAEPVLRIQRVGKVFFVQHLHKTRSLGPGGAEVVEDDWKVVAVAKPDANGDGRMDAFKWMIEANGALVRMAQES